MQLLRQSKRVSFLKGKTFPSKSFNNEVDEAVNMLSDIYYTVTGEVEIF